MTDGRSDGLRQSIHILKCIDKFCWGLPDSGARGQCWGIVGHKCVKNGVCRTGQAGPPFTLSFLNATTAEAAPSFRVLCERVGVATAVDASMFIRHIAGLGRRSRMSGMPRRLYRCYGLGYLHFITSSCYQRQAFLNAPRRTLFLEILEQVRLRYNFVVVGYVIMPEHFHLMISEPEVGNPSTVMQVLKQRFARTVLEEGRERHESTTAILKDESLVEGHFWQPRFYDFPVWTKDKRQEKLRYMHNNPVKRGLVLEPEQWEWSSYRHYAFGESGRVLVNEAQLAPMRVRKVNREDEKAAG